MDIKVGGAWKKGIPYIKVGGVWKKGVASWTKVAGVWKKMTYTSYVFYLESYGRTNVKLRPTTSASSQQDVCYYKQDSDRMFAGDSYSPGIIENPYGADTLRFGTYIDRTANNGYFYVELGFTSTSERTKFLQDHTLNSRMNGMLGATYDGQGITGTFPLIRGAMSFKVAESRDKTIYLNQGDTRGTVYHTVTMRTDVRTLSSSSRDIRDRNLWGVWTTLKKVEATSTKEMYTTGRAIKLGV